MASKSVRNSVSMRDSEYIALGMYMEELNKHQGGDPRTRTAVLKMVLFGELPPIPQKYLDA